MDGTFASERRLAELAVQKAVIATKQVLQLVEKGGELANKKDNTCVSLADFAAQALLVAAIHHAFPEDTIVGEEDTALLREKPELAAKVWDLVSSSVSRLADDAEDSEEALLHSPQSLQETLDCIGLGGNAYGCPEGRVWMIDPVDGTKGFLSNGQYVVCAVLLVDGEEKVAAFGCPHLDIDSGKVSEGDACTDGPGVLISAARGQGAFVRPLSSQGALASPRPLGKRDDDPALNGLLEKKLRFCENTKTTSPQFADRHKIAAELGAPWDPIHIYSTQLRYISLALGFSDVVLRTPLPDDVPAHVWDHAGGVMLFEETGGKVSDLNGKPLVFTAGRELTENFGLVAAPASIHPRVVEAAKAVLSSYPEYAGIIK